MNTPIISIESVTKTFGRLTALDRVSVDIMQGEFFSLLGPSGCGKTTLLRAIAGFSEPDDGRISIDGLPMSGVEANRRPTNMVFQSYAIFPHMTVAENVGFGLRRQRLDKAEQGRMVTEALQMVSLAGFEDRDAKNLSGGQKQRVALARALILRPKVLLLDEPLSALDKKLREQMQSELRNLQRAVGITFVLVTHDQEEALTMSDRIAVMFDGRIVQVSAPSDIYTAPASRQVAEFLGNMNFLPAVIGTGTETDVPVDIKGLGNIEFPREQAGEHAPGTTVSAGIRPEMLTILFDDGWQHQRAEGSIADRSYYGDMTYYDVRLADADIIVTISMRNTANRPILPIGTTVPIGWGIDSVVLL